MQNAGNRLNIVVRKRYCHENQKNVILFCKVKEYGESIFRNTETQMDWGYSSELD